jgi:hypothetical protein
MEVPKKDIIKYLQQRGESDKAEAASRELPDRVDPQRDREMLDRIGIEPQDVRDDLGGLGDT